MGQMTLATSARIVVRGPGRVNTGRISLVADEMTAGCRLHGLVTVGTRHVADAMIAGSRRHLALAETTIDAPTVEVVTAVIVANHRPPPGGIVGAVTRFRGRHLVSGTNLNVTVLLHTERVNGTGTVLVITTAEDIIYRTGIGIAGVDEDVHHREYLL